MFDMFGKNNSEFFNELFNPKWETKVGSYPNESLFLVIRQKDKYYYFINPEKYFQHGSTYYFGNPVLEIEDDKSYTVSSKVIHFIASEISERFYTKNQFIDNFKEYKNSQENKEENN
jgi:hypothetical protein